jgi:hypothetical protein
MTFGLCLLFTPMLQLISEVFNGLWVTNIDWHIPLGLKTIPWPPTIDHFHDLRQGIKLRTNAFLETWAGGCFLS